VMITRPRCVRVGWEYVEYELEYDADVVRVLPATTGLRELERDLNRMAEARAYCEELRAERARLTAQATSRQEAAVSNFKILYGTR
jgi:hypothetical protein